MVGHGTGLLRFKTATALKVLKYIWTLGPLAVHLLYKWQSLGFVDSLVHSNCSPIMVDPVFMRSTYTA